MISDKFFQTFNTPVSDKEYATLLFTVTPTYISSISCEFYILSVLIKPSKFHIFNVVSFDEVINVFSLIQLKPVILLV